MKTIVLLSGGLDSALVLALCVKEKWECHALAFDYCQPHAIPELAAAEAIADHYHVPLDIVDTWRAFDFPKVDDVVFAGRNMVFAALACSIAQARGHEAIAVGCNASDWMRFPDCRPPFWHNMRLAAEAYGIAIKTPLLHFSKIEVVEAAREAGVPIDMTWSCYDPVQKVESAIKEIAYTPCGKCLACEIRNAALAYRNDEVTA